jgi:two-component system, NtrC family, sensor kinase
LFPPLAAADEREGFVNYRQYKVLYVDDEAANLTSFRYCFDEHFDVITAASAEEALAILAREPIALLLADQRMPGMSGAELCKLVRERHPDVVRMILTAYADIGAAVAAINAGQVSKYLMKPWREEAMSEVLRAGLDAYQLAVMTRELQVRLLATEQQSTTTYLLGRVLHELANPAAALNTNVEWLADTIGALTRRRDLPDAVAAELTEMMAAVREATAASRELLQRIDRFRRGEQPRPKPEGVDLKRAVAAALAIVESQLRKRAELTVELGDVPPVLADATQVSQIVINLLLNAADAVDARPDGARRIALRVHGDGAARAIIEVADSGDGIAPELLAHIFEPFVSTKSQDVPRGFGLAVVREIVETVGGEIRVRSELGDGAHFTVSLPVAGAR